MIADPKVASTPIPHAPARAGTIEPMTREPKHKVSRRFGFDVYGTGGRQLERRLANKPGGRWAGRAGAASTACS
jgi:hypothetical protein